MQERTFVFFRKFSHILLFVISLTFTVMLLVEFSEQFYERVLWGMLGTGLEFIKLYIFILAKYHFFRRDWRHYVAAGSHFVLYVGIAFVSMIATVGFALNTIEGQSFSVRQERADVESVERELDRMEEQIEVNMQRYEDLPSDWVTVSEQYLDRIEDLRDRRDELTEERNRLLDEADTQQEAINTFALIGEQIGMSARSTLFNIMMVLVVLLEVGLVSTTGSVERKRKEPPPAGEKVEPPPPPVESAAGPVHSDDGDGEKDNTFSRSLYVPKEETGGQTMAELERYVDALTSTATSRLKSDEAISRETELPLPRCQHYRSLLRTTSYRNVPLITVRQGGSRANFSVKNLKKILRFLHHQQRILT